MGKEERKVGGDATLGGLFEEREGGGRESRVVEEREIVAGGRLEERWRRLWRQVGREERWEEQEGI